MSSPIDKNLVNLRKIQGLPGWVAHWNESEGFQLLYTNDSSLPALAGNTDCAVVFDGFLQNRSELFAAMGLERNSLRNEAEIILLAFSKWEEDIVHRLRGVFLLAIWDKKRNVLLYVRDHCGIYPAFYSNTGSEFVFSTSTENIVRHPRVTQKLNRSAFVDFLCHRRPLPEETFYADIQRVLAGHAVRVSKGKQQGFRYWYSFPPGGQQEYVTDPEAAGFDQALEKAVSRCMRIGNPGIFLSGGLDSVSIASVAAALAMKNGTPLPRGFSLGFPHPDCNEVDRQESVAQGLGLELCMVQVNDIIAGRGLLTMGLELGRTWSQPMWNTWQPLYLVLGSKAREMGCEMVMTGAGGDEWLTVSDTLTADLIRHVDPGGLKRLIPILLRSYRLPKTAFLWHILWRSGLRLVLADYGRRLARQVAPDTLRHLIRKRMRGSTAHWVAADPELQAMANDRVEILVDEYMSRMKPRGKYPFYSNSFGNHFINTITSMEMEQNFEAAQRMGVTLAYPYFDPDLIHLLLRISPEVLQQGGMEKGIVRSAVARRFPGLNFERQKKVSAMSFWQSIITTEGRDLFYQTGGPATLIQMGIVNGNAIGPVMDKAFASKSPFQNTKIWDLLLLEAWLRSRIK